MGQTWDKTRDTHMAATRIKYVAHTERTEDQHGETEGRKTRHTGGQKHEKHGTKNGIRGANEEPTRDKHATSTEQIQAHGHGTKKTTNTGRFSWIGSSLRAHVDGDSSLSRSWFRLAIDYLL